ncbi:MAG: hypothetical protein INR71_10740, partial [Terriglobus roseus]|nr:hypothetical protein [Terriglobus roseus]
LLYEQPDDFAIPEAYDYLESPDINTPEGAMVRVGFNLSNFAEAANLGEPIAANYMRVLNGTEAETSSAATITGTVGVAPTEEPTTVATTDSEAAASASASASAAEGESGSGSGTADASSPVETGDETSGAGAVFAGVQGLAMAAVGAAVFL